MPQSLSAFSASVPPSAKIWDEVMSKVQDLVERDNQDNGVALKSFTDAAGVIECNYCMDSGKVYGDNCKADPRARESLPVISRLQRCLSMLAMCMFSSPTTPATALQIPAAEAPVRWRC